MNMKITPNEFENMLLSICDTKTSHDPDRWTPNNPLCGHCAVVALLAQDLFGGELLRASLEGTEFAYMRSHYWNKLPDGTEIDFTDSQFKGCYPENLKPEIREREHLLSHSATKERYEILARRFKEAVIQYENTAGMWYVVEYHARGCERCVPGRKSFRTPEEAWQFAEMQKNNGHYCNPDCIVIYGSMEKLEDQGI